MNKRTVNLFSGPLGEIHQTHGRYLYVRNITIVLSVLFFIGIIAAYFVQSKLTGDLLTDQADRSQYEKALELAKMRQVQLHSIAVRMKALQKAMQNDIQFASRSARLQQLITENDIPVRFQELSFSSGKDFTARLAFATEGDLLAFVAHTETPIFRKSFTRFTLGDFEISASSSATLSKLLDFSGTLL